ncbi:uncharacterized protein LOC116851878 isoform X2 [Odontomachus brunneus]|uniref:uncharacterized protein LOC116851878 isoform X2 n=1 Tax=Odontomachus brunneus TaxID=486640 RepID=UPI0013F18C7F|nr:uncharacterized protein LOC116851878 isoform X2 [Odontomachus brunneus]
MEQQLKCNEPNNWYPCTIFSRRYHNYAVVVMARPILIEPQKMFQIWEKVTVSDGICRWVQCLENAGIDVFSGQYNKYVPKIIIAERVDRSINDPPTIIDRLETLGSRVIYLPHLDDMKFNGALNRIVDCAHELNITLRDMYVFAESETNFDIFQVIETLRISDGNIRNVEIIIVSNSHFCWMLRRGVHKIRVAQDEKMENTPMCSFVVFNYRVVNNLTTTGLQTNFTNVSATELGETKDILCKKTVVTVDTNASIIWVMSLDVTKQNIFDEFYINVHDESELDR